MIHLSPFRSTDPRKKYPNAEALDLFKHHIRTLDEVSQIENLFLHRSTLPHNIQRSLSRPSRSKQGLEVFDSFAREVYHEGVQNPSTPGGGIQEGGGPLTMAIKTVKNFCLSLKTIILYSNVKEINILWVGIGMAEEAILVTKFFQKQDPPIPIKIYGIELDSYCVREAKRLIEKAALADIIEVVKLNFLNFKPTRNYTCIYSSAAVGDIFNMKLLYTSIQCCCQWFFHCNHLPKCYNDLKIPAEGYNPSWIKGVLSGSLEKRNIIYIVVPFINDNIKECLIQRSRELVIGEFCRNFTGANDKIVDVYQRYFRSRRPEETTFTLSLNDIIKRQSYYDDFTWSDFIIDFSAESRMELQLQERVVHKDLKDRIVKHFTNQFNSHGVDVKLFPDLFTPPTESESEVRP